MYCKILIDKARATSSRQQGVLKTKNIIIKDYYNENHKKKTSNLQLKYTPSAGWLNINFGGEIFRLLKGEIMLDKTPYSDETLVPIENPTIEGDIFSYQVGKTLYKMDCSTMEGAMDLALLVEKLKNETKIIENSIDENFEITLEKNEFAFSIGDFNRRILIDYNEYGNEFIERFPEPTKCYKMGDYYVENGTNYREKFR